MPHNYFGLYVTFQFLWTVKQLLRFQFVTAVHGVIMKIYCGNISLVN